jgi:hypothetical protein
MEVKSYPKSKIRPPETTEEIVRYLGSSRSGERIQGLIAACRKRPPAALDPLVRVARRDPVFAEAAVHAISVYPDPQGANALLAAMRSSRPEARAAAATAFCWRKASSVGPLEGALRRAVRRDRDWRVRASAARALRVALRGRFGAATEIALQKGMDDRRENGPVRLECAAALARAGVDAGWVFLGAGASSRDSDRAALALNLTGSLGGRRAAGILTTALYSPRPELWTVAAASFALLDRTTALVALSRRAESDGEAGLRAALALAPFEGRSLRDRLLAALNRGNTSTRTFACRALVRALGADAATVLELKLTDSREAASVRIAAAQALGEVGGPVIAASLRAVSVDDTDETVRAAARDALLLVEARLKKGSAAVSEAEAERYAFARWQLVAVLPGPAIGCRLRDERGREKVYRIGDRVALGYTLARVLTAGEESRSPEVVAAGRAAIRTDLLRAVLTKDDRAVVMVAPAIAAER